MIVFAFYAALSWYLAAKWRRTWKGFLSQAVSIALLLGLIRLFQTLGRAETEDPGRFLSIILLLGFEVGVVGLIGLLICCVPRGAPSPRHCRKCHYDLTGLNAAGQTAPAATEHVVQCPECGSLSFGKDEREGLLPIPTAPPDGPRRVNL